MLSTALLLGAPVGSVMAAPQSVAQPALPPMDHRGILGTVADGVVGVADRGNELMSRVRSRASGLVDSAINILGVRYRLGGSSVEKPCELRVGDSSLARGDLRDAFRERRRIGGARERPPVPGAPPRASSAQAA